MDYIPLYITSLIAVFLVPPPYFDVDFYTSSNDEVAIIEDTTYSDKLTWLADAFKELPAVELLVTCVVLSVGVFCHVCEWIQRKLLRRRLLKLHGALSCRMSQLASLECDERMMAATSSAVKAAETEYTLLLMLLTQRERQDC